jgi:hypothetical protein
LNYLHGANGKPRQINGKDASLAEKIARIDAAVIRFRAPSAESQTETHACPIRAALLERAKELVDAPARQTAALIPHLDKHALGLASTLSVTVVRGLVNLNAFCSRFSTTAVSTSRSARISTPWSSGVTVSLTPRAFASKVEAEAISSMNAATPNCSGF